MFNLDAILARFRKWILIAGVILLAGAFTMTHLPGQDLPNFHASDKTLHVTGFAGLSTCFVFLLNAYGWPRRRRILTIVIALMAYAAFDEKTQPYFHRTQDIMDWLADTCGTLLAIGIWEPLLALARKRLSRQSAKDQPQAIEK